MTAGAEEDQDVRFKGLDLNLIVALDALLSEQNVSRAAEKVFRSQSAMSGALARLREHFQDELLAPLGRRMVLTEAGRDLVAPVRRLMEQIEQTLDVSAAFDPASAVRRFTLALAEQDAELMAPQIVARAGRQAPQVSFELVSAAGGGEMIESGRADLMVAGERAPSRVIDAEPLYVDDYVALADPEHGPRGADLAIDRFLAAPRLAVQFGPYRALSFAEQQMRRTPGAAAPVLHVASLASAPRFVAGTGLICLVNRVLGETLAREHGLSVFKPPIPLTPLRVMLHSRPTAREDTGVAWLKALIHGCAADLYGSA